MALSLLLLAPEPAATKLAQVLRQELVACIDCAEHRRNSFSALHREDFSLILLDENLAAAEPDATHALYANAGIAPVLEMNLAICSADRVLRQVRAALNRRAQDEAKARVAAAAALGNEFNASLTGLLLESQLALRHAGPEIAPALQHMVLLAAELRDQFRVQRTPDA